MPRQQRPDDVVTRTARKRTVPDLAGKTFGTWRVLYESEVSEKRTYMCQCVRCGVKKYIMAIKLWQGYALKCRECKIRRDLEKWPAVAYGGHRAV